MIRTLKNPEIIRRCLEMGVSREDLERDFGKTAVSNALDAIPKKRRRRQRRKRKAA